MQCEKTGCQVFFEEYQTYAIGDAYVLQRNEYTTPIWIFRISGESYTGPLRKQLHFKVNVIEHIFDGTPKTFVVLPEDLVYLGYDGEEIN